MNKRILTLVLVIFLVSADCIGTTVTQPPPPQVVIVTVEVLQAPVPAQSQPPAQPLAQLPSQPVQPVPAQPTQLPPQPTQPQQGVSFTASRDLSCADGPSWYKYNFIIKFAEYDTAEVVGVNGSYGLVKYKEKTCWVLLTEGEVKGNLDSLPFVEAPHVPLVEVWVTNDLGQYVYLVFFDWETGEKVKTLALDPGKSIRIKVPSGYYSIQGYTKKDQKIYQSGMINLGVGDSNQLPGLLDGEAEVVIF